MLQQHELFVSGADGYHTYRIPALVVSTAGTVLALCEGRLEGGGDSGQIDLLLKRSEDGGRTWSPQRVVVSVSAMTCGNPCPVVDASSGRILLPFCQNRADGPESEICAGRAPRTVWLTCSDDDGHTWSQPRQITDQTKDPAWTWYATGPCHGIQLTSGRLVVPCDHMVGVYHDRKRDPYHSHVILSDDGGDSWRIGGIVEEGTNECAIVETADGSLYINCRNYRGQKLRAAARSWDGGESFGARAWVDAHPEPICQGALVTWPLPGDGGGSASNRILFANPASQTAREMLTVRLSEDGGRSWPSSRSLYDGPAAYADLAVVDSDEVLCLYERGAQASYETLTLARFDASWLQGE